MSVNRDEASTTAEQSRVVIASNRLPVRIHREPGQRPVLVPSTGGLATGLARAHRASNGLWFGWSGLDRELEGEERALMNSAGLEPLDLDSTEIEGFYQDISNRALWPLLHGFTERVVWKEGSWETYRLVNERFAERIAASLTGDELVLVQDYHLALLPALLRERLPRLRIGHFMHIPFPAPEVFRVFPRRTALLEGLLGADAVGFHTAGYAANFRESCERIVGHLAQGTELRVGPRTVSVYASPLGLDVDTWTDDGDAAEVEREMARLEEEIGGRRVVLGVERLDYSKGIPERLEAFGGLLEDAPELAEEVVFFQVAVPSRTALEDYAELESEVAEIAGRINASAGRIGRQPLHYQFGGVERSRLKALYRLADVCMVTPLRDGLNLVAKEYVACRGQDDGVLVLSEFAGAAEELHEAIPVNPYDPMGMKAALRQALDMDEDEQRRRMAPMRERTLANTVERWTEDALQRLVEAPRSTSAKPLRGDEAARLVGELSSQETRALILDYDGTLREFTDDPAGAVPPQATVDLLTELAATTGTSLWVVSGRDRDFLASHLGETGAGLVAEHGAFVRWPDAARDRFERLLGSDELPWRAGVRRRMARAAGALQHSFVEEKSAGLAWHYRAADRRAGQRAARTLRNELRLTLAREPVEVMAGDHVIEVRSRDVTKAAALQRLADMHHFWPEGALIAGDDVTDETMFEAFADVSHTVLVGDRETAAHHRVPHPAALRALLAELLAAITDREEGSGVRRIEPRESQDA